MALLPEREHHYHPWREVEERRLREWIDAGVPMRMIAVRLCRTTVAVRTMARRLGIVPPPARRDQVA